MVNLMKNGSGYNDPTAFKAIKDTEGTHENNEGKHSDGEIVKIMKPSGFEESVILLRCHESYASSTFLRGVPPAENFYKVANGYIDAGRCGYIFYDTITEKTGRLTEKELYNVRQIIAQTIGAEIYAPVEEKLAEPVEVPEVTANMDELINRLEELKALAKSEEARLHECVTQKEEIMRMEIERDVYKAAFEKMVGGIL